MQDITSMNYSEFVGFIGERNRPSGGITTVHTVSVNAFLSPSKKVLEIGSNTGFTSVNLHLLTGCEVVGVDTNDSSVEKAERYAREQEVQDRVVFMNANACSLPFDDNSFDMVWCSNVTSFISEKERAISEYMRVLKPGGTLVVIPIYYIQNPPHEIVAKVAEAIGAEVNIRDKEGWKNIVEHTAREAGYVAELFFEEDRRYQDVSSRISEYVDMLLTKEDVAQLTVPEQSVIRARAEYFYHLFNENLTYAGYSILLYQKRIFREEVELFLTEKI